MRQSFVLGLGIFSFLLAGCADRTCELQGDVSLKGEKVPTGVVTFFPDQGEPVAAFIQDGKYTVKLLYGSYRVAVTDQSESPEVITSAGPPQKPGESNPAAKSPPPPKKTNKVTIPQKFNSVDTSKLSCKVDQAKKDYPIALD
jgi:hypothetical protein